MEIEPLTFKELREFAKVCENGQPCLFDVHVIGRISRVQEKRKEQKTSTKVYYSVTIRSLQDESDFFIVLIDKTLLNKKLEEGLIVYAKGTLFKIEDFVYLNAREVKVLG